MRARRLLFLIAALCVISVLPAPCSAASPREGRKKKQEELSAELLPLLDAAAAQAVPEALDALVSAAILRHGSLAPLFDRLESAGPAFPEHRLRALLLAREGDLMAAASLLAELCATPQGAGDVALWRALACARDMLGDRDEALSAYSRLLDLCQDAGERGRAELRVALLRSNRNGGGDPPLLAMARAAGGDWPERVAPLLAVTGEFAAAANLARARDAGAEDFAESVRLSSWALAAADLAGARAQAERALEAARLPRDRRYALAVLVEAHRAGGALEELCERFAVAPDLSAEAREVWIDLLRELGQAEQAMRLFESTADGRFTPEMRRELLEMCREAGAGEVLVESFRRLIAAEPAMLEWREGLARHFLERGDRQAAEAVWLELLESLRDDPGGLMRSASSLAGLGLSALAERFARQAGEQGGAVAAALFLCDLKHRLGQPDAARAALDDLRAKLAPEDPERVRLAEAYERIGRQAEAVQVLEGFRADERAEDVDMRLAWLYSQVGRDADALALWREIWEAAASLPRQRHAEDRLLNVAARIGALADIAVDLEEKIAAGAATPRERGLLVNLYTLAGDPVSAAEVLAEHARGGGGEIASLKETARVYLTCCDFRSYERTLHQLLAADPAGREDYLAQLAMSALERARPEDAKKALEELKETPGQEAGERDEFAAGVLALAGLRDEAIAAYRRALVLHPDRIEAWLLLGGCLAEEGEGKPRAVGLFQQLAEAADKDDLFTVAIDGLLNVDAPRLALEWASRAVLERIALRPEKAYLYQLLADVAEAMQDTDLLLRALEEALPAAGERRLALLRELMELAAENGRDDQSLTYGRRALLLGEHAPPEVYVALGEALLKKGEARAAAQTFSRASDVPDYNAFQRGVARSFEEHGYVAEALRQYEGLLAAQSADVELLAKVAELDEELGRDEAAHGLYARALDLMFARRPVTAAKESASSEEARPRPSWGGRNVDAYDQYYERVLAGFLATLSPRAPVGDILQRAAEPLAGDLAEALSERAAGAAPSALSDFPKVAARAEYLRRLAFARRETERANAVDLELLAAFGEDRDLLAKLVEERLEWGFEAAALDLVERSPRLEEENGRVRRLLASGPAQADAGALRQKDALRRLLELIAWGRAEEGRLALQQIGFEPLAEADLEALPALTAYAAHIQDAESSLLLARRWISAAVRFQNSYMARAEAERACALVWPVLDAAQQRSLAGDLVRLLLKEPQKHAPLAGLVATLQEVLGQRLVALEQAEEAIAALDSKRFHTVSGLLGLCAEAERLELVRSIWQDVPADHRALFLLDFVGSLEEEAAPESKDFIKERFAASLGELKGGLRLSTIERDLLGREHNLDLAVDLLAAAQKQDPRNVEVLAGHALCLAQAGQPEEARRREGEALARILDQSELTWQAERALDALLDRRDDYADLLALIDERESKKGAAPLSALARAEILVRAESDPRRSIDSLRAAIERLPGEAALCTLLSDLLAGTGSEFERLQVEERLLEQNPDESWRRPVLQRAWRQARNPPRAERFAERARNVEEKTRASATPHAIKEAIDRGDLDEARRVTRRMWRGLDEEWSSFHSLNLLGQPWPEDGAEEPRRGGLPDLEGSASEAREEEKPSVCDVLAEKPFGEDELRRLLAGMAPDEVERAGDVIDAAARAAALRLGPAAAVEEVLELMRQGRAARVDRARLLSLLNQGQEALLPNAGQVAADLLSAVSPRDRAQVTRLARLFARLGQPDQAARLFLWAAVLVDLGEGDGRSGFGRASAETLLAEVREVLEGDLKVATSTAILERARPALVSSGADPLAGMGDAALDDYGARVLGAWKELAAPAEVLERNRGLCDSLLQEHKSPPRRAALLAAEVFFHAGDWENGIAALEIALCGKKDEAFAPAPEQLAALLPEPSGAPDAAAAQYGRVAQALETWLAEKRLDRRLAAELLSIVAARLGQAGAAARGLEILARAAELGAPWASVCLWVSDAARLLGDQDLAFHVERGLLEEMRLDVERIPATVRAVALREGNDAAFALGERAAEFTLHPDLLEFLIATAERLGKNERAAHWRGVAEEAQAAKVRGE